MKAVLALLVIALGLAWPSLAEAQLRGHREGLDMSSLAVVAGLFVLGIGAYVLARGRR